MRQKTLISALVLTAFVAVPSTANAADIFIKKNKDPVQEQPVEETAPQQNIPGTTIKARPAPVIPQGPTSPATVPGAPPMQQPPLTDLKTGVEPCTREDSERILQMDSSLKRTKDVGPEDSNVKSWMNFAKDPEKINEMIKLYTRCSAFLAEYKKAQNPGAKGKPKQTAKPVLR